MYLPPLALFNPRGYSPTYPERYPRLLHHQRGPGRPVRSPDARLCGGAGSVGAAQVHAVELGSTSAPQKRGSL
jgi:hypothetical protein